MLHKFDDMRPYCAEEIPQAMNRIVCDEHFERLAQYIFPDKAVDDVREMIRQIRTTDEFQLKIMYHVNQQILDRSIEKLTYEGLERLSPTKSYLFVSNHRDIMLDSSLLQYILHINGFRTTEITFGSNLMNPQLIVDIGKANKMFKVVRSSNIREFLGHSMLLSEYIRYTVCDKGESVWIAQRNGRTKDGNDATDQGIVKMFCMSHATDPVEGIDSLNIVPVAISYQIESCDMLKTRELYLTRDGEKYTKQPDEDLNSIITGVLQPKGRVHINVCEPLRRDELDVSFKYPNEFYRAVATLIDKRIYKNYQLFNNNYIACDMLAGKDAYADRYTPDERDAFAKRCRYATELFDGDKERIRSIFLGIYANPVKNAHQYRHDI